MDRRRFVLVPGGWHGGWTFDALAERLRAAGHEVEAVTLAGLEEQPDDRAPTPNLDTHIDQVVAILQDPAAPPAVLAGHSYAGMVIAGAADRAPGRVSHLVFLDAYVPADGDTCWTLTSDHFREVFVEGARADGRTVPPAPGPETRRRPHPLPSMMQAIRLGGGAPAFARTFVYGGPWRGSPFVELAEALRADPGWTVHDLLVGHDVMNRDPDAVAAILLAD